MMQPFPTDLLYIHVQIILEVTILFNLLTFAAKAWFDRRLWNHLLQIKVLVTFWSGVQAVASTLLIRFAP